MKNLSKKSKIYISISIVITVLVSLFLLFYTVLLPKLVSSSKVISFVEKSVENLIDVDLDIQKPFLKTSLKPEIEFGFEKISIKKDSNEILLIENLDTNLSFSKILRKTIILKKIGLDNFYADVNGLLSLVGNEEQPQQTTQKSSLHIDWLNSLLYLKKCHVVYAVDKETTIQILGKDMEITSSREPKFVRFDLDIDILKKNDKDVKFSISDRDNVFIKNHKLVVEKGILNINKSKVFINAEATENNDFVLDVFSDNFEIANAVELLETNLIVPNGKEMLSYFKDINGSVDVNIHLTNDDLKGLLKLNSASLKVVPLNNLPVKAENGVVEITANDVYLKDFQGWYGSSKANAIKFEGTVKDYTKSVDMDIEATGVATNDLAQNYLSKVVGIPLTLIGKSGAKILVKSKYGKMDFTYMGKIATGDDILVDGASLSPTGYDRAVVADFHLDGNILDIKSIKYYIAKELNKNTKGVKPILTIDGKTNIANGYLYNVGFDIPKPLPSEFLNVLIGQKLFRKGTISGKMQFVNDERNPQLQGSLAMDKVRVPSQRLFVNEGRFYTDKDLIHIDAFGRFKRSEWKFDGDIKNNLLFPIVVKDIRLTVDNIDVEKVLTSMNNQPASSGTTNTKLANTEIPENDNDEDDTADDNYTFNTGLLIVENCVLEVVKGFYKNINFGNLKAVLTLNHQGILEIRSNKFDFAEGISTLKVFCDLQKQKYFIKLGVKDINADLIASELLMLPKEISGKAKGLIELNTDKTMKLNGRIRFDVKNGTIQKVGLVEYALKFASLFRNPMAMISPSTIVDLVNIPEGNFDDINGDIVLVNNVIEKIMIKSRAPQLSSFIIGRYDMEIKDAALRIYTKFSNKNKGLTGVLRHISLNSLANKVSLSNNNESLYYSAELDLLPPIDADEKDCHVFLTKVDGDVEHFNFLSSLKKIK